MHNLRSTGQATKCRWLMMIYPLTISNTDKSLFLSEVSDTFRRSSAIESDSLSFGCRCLWFLGVVEKKNWSWSAEEISGRFPLGFGLLVVMLLVVCGRGRTVVLLAFGLKVVLLGLGLTVVLLVAAVVGNLILFVVEVVVVGALSSNLFPFSQTSIIVFPLDSVKIT